MELILSDIQRAIRLFKHEKREINISEYIPLRVLLSGDIPDPSSTFRFVTITTNADGVPVLYIKEQGE